MQEQDSIIEGRTPAPMKKITLVQSGEDYFSRLLKLISSAQSEIHLQTYIFENDTTGNMVAEALKDAALRHVKVYLLLDGYGSAYLPKKFVNSLTKHGINIRFFSPLFSRSSFNLGRRLHHKIAVADNRVVLIGGINIADKYRGNATKIPWLDYAVQFENEAMADYLRLLCTKIYMKKKRMQRRIKPAFHFSEDVSVKIIQNDWLKRKNEISNAYIKALRNAKEEIIIVGSYFLPGIRLTKALKRASRRGVKVKLILSGISDVPLVKRATEYLYASLLNSGIELYEWNTSVLHGKVAVADGKWATVGSFNLNHLSAYASIEMNVEIFSCSFAESLTVNLKAVIAQCEQVTHKTYAIRNGFFAKIRNWLAYSLVRIALVIATFIPQKRFSKWF